MTLRFSRLITASLDSSTAFFFPGAAAAPAYSDARAEQPDVALILHAELMAARISRSSPSLAGPVIFCSTSLDAWWRDDEEPECKEPGGPSATARCSPVIKLFCRPFCNPLQTTNTASRRLHTTTATAERCCSTPMQLEHAQRLACETPSLVRCLWQPSSLGTERRWVPAREVGRKSSFCWSNLEVKDRVDELGNTASSVLILGRRPLSPAFTSTSQSSFARSQSAQSIRSRSSVQSMRSRS